MKKLIPYTIAAVVIFFIANTFRYEVTPSPHGKLIVYIHDTWTHRIWIADSKGEYAMGKYAPWETF